jgi:hypothetical protein
VAGRASLSSEGQTSRSGPDRQEKTMFTHPDRLGQLAREHHHDMLAQASQRSLRNQPGSRPSAAPNAAARITRRLAEVIVRARIVASRAADTI